MIPILCYHRIADLPLDHPLRPHSVTPPAFARQMAFLAARGYCCVSLADALALAGGVRHGAGGSRYDPSGAAYSTRAYPAGGRRPFALTFDDGALDCYQVALPICESHGFRPTVFLVSGWLAGQGEDSALGPLLSPAHVLEMRGRGVAFGAHSRTHRPLVDLPAAELAAEICGCKAELEQLLGEPVAAFAYPYGLSDQATRAAAAACGYALAVAVANGTDDRFNLRRQPIGAYDTLLSLAWKTSPWPARYRRLRAVLPGSHRQSPIANRQSPIDN